MNPGIPMQKPACSCNCHEDPEESSAKVWYIKMNKRRENRMMMRIHDRVVSAISRCLSGSDSFGSEPESWTKGVRFNEFKCFRPIWVRQGPKMHVSRSAAHNKFSLLQHTNWNRD